MLTTSPGTGADNWWLAIGWWQLVDPAAAKLRCISSAVAIRTGQEVPVLHHTFFHKMCVIARIWRASRLCFEGALAPPPMPCTFSILVSPGLLADLMLKTAVPLDSSSHGHLSGRPFSRCRGWRGKHLRDPPWSGLGRKP